MSEREKRIACVARSLAHSQDRDWDYADTDDIAEWEDVAELIVDRLE